MGYPQTFLGRMKIAASLWLITWDAAIFYFLFFLGF